MHSRLSCRWLVGTLLFALLLAAGVGNIAFKRQSAKNTETVVPLTVGTSIDTINTAIFVAQEKGFFADENVQVTLKNFPSGQAALEAQLTGEPLDIVTVAPLPIAQASVKRHDFSIVASFVSPSKAYKIVARKDKAIQTLADLKNKKIGTVKGTSAHFFLEKLLEWNDVIISDSNVIDLKPDELVRALQSGQLAAIAIWEPYAYTATRALGDTAVVFSADKFYTSTFELVSKNELIKNRPEAIPRFLRSIDRANTFIQENQAETARIMAQMLGLDEHVTQEILKEYRFKLSLEQDLLLELDEAAKWLNIAPAPNYFTFIYADGLKEVKPEVVTIIY